MSFGKGVITKAVHSGVTMSEWSWFGHVISMHEVNFVMKVYETKGEGVRGVK